MEIDLSRIPEDGENYIFNQNTGELNESLQDLIGSSLFEVQLFIKPLPQSTFQVTGRIKTQLPEDCGKCGDPFLWPVDQKVNELLVPNISHQRGDKYQKPNHLSDTIELSDVEAYNYTWPYLNVGDFVHEIIVIAEPAYPHPPIKPNGQCSFCDRIIGKDPIQYEEPGFEKVKTGLTDLKKIKLNS